MIVFSVQYFQLEENEKKTGLRGYLKSGREENLAEIQELVPHSQSRKLAVRNRVIEAKGEGF